MVLEQDLTEKWLGRLRVTARSQDGRASFAQLNAIVDLFNKKSSNTGLKTIDWDEWDETIHTPKVVSKIRSKYDNFMGTTYEVAEAASRVDTQTDKLDALDIAVTYNYALWLSHYSQHVDFIEGVRNIGDVSDLSEKEVLKYAPHIDVWNQANLEIGDTTPEDYNENGITNRMVTQFAWGSKFNPPFLHASDALNAIASTLGKLGK